MNERLMRAAPQYFAEFITAFADSEQRATPQRGPVRYSALPHLGLIPLPVLHIDSAAHISGEI